jgi:hypothetical protein
VDVDDVDVDVDVVDVVHAQGHKQNTGSVT